MSKNDLKAKGFKMKVMKCPNSVMTHGHRKTEGSGWPLPKSNRQEPGLLYERGEPNLRAGSNSARLCFEERTVWEPNTQLKSTGHDEPVFRPQAFYPSKASVPFSPGVVARNHSGF